METLDPDARKLIGAYESYLRRQLGRGDQVVTVLGPGEHRIPPDADAVVALGPVGLRRRCALRRAAADGLTERFSGIAAPGGDVAKGAKVSILDRWDPAAVSSAPESFDVLAIVAVFNEEDVIGPLIDRLVADGIRVHVVDNWSTDSTPALLASRAGGQVTVERWPSGGPSPYFELGPLLARVEEIAHGSRADWIIHHDADEIREAPWPGVGLREALWAVDRWGFNCVDHTIIEFRPIDESWTPGGDLTAPFDFFEFGPYGPHFNQFKAWKRQTARVPIAASGGHSQDFPGRKVFPHKFLTRHYPIRSTEHGRRKVLQERKARWSPEERAKGWHIQYDDYDETSSFVSDPARLKRWADIDRCWLIQRLSGATLPGNPRPAEAAS